MLQESFGQVVIQVPARVTDEFKKKAKQNFPNEAFAYLLGHYTDTAKIVVDDLYIPEDVDQFCRPNSVSIQPHWIRKARKHAKAINASVVGDIHSHPYNKEQAKVFANDTSPSETDWNNLKQGQIMAVCIVREGRDGRLRARTTYWGPMPLVKFKETK